MFSAYYSVEQSWSELFIKFSLAEYFDKVLEAAQSRYNDASWTEPARKQIECCASTSTGTAVKLRFILEANTLIVTDNGNNAWVMNDYQNICKNITITGQLQ